MKINETELEKDMQLLAKYMLKLAEKYPEMYIDAVTIDSQKTCDVTYHKLEYGDKYRHICMGNKEVETW